MSSSSIFVQGCCSRASGSDSLSRIFSRTCDLCFSASEYYTSSRNKGQGWLGKQLSPESSSGGRPAAPPQRAVVSSATVGENFSNFLLTAGVNSAPAHDHIFQHFNISLKTNDPSVTWVNARALIFLSCLERDSCLFEVCAFTRTLPMGITDSRALMPVLIFCSSQHLATRTDRVTSLSYKKMRPDSFIVHMYWHTSILILTRFSDFKALSPLSVCDGLFYEKNIGESFRFPDLPASQARGMHMRLLDYLTLTSIREREHLLCFMRNRCSPKVFSSAKPMDTHPQLKTALPCPLLDNLGWPDPHPSLAPQPWLRLFVCCSSCMFWFWLVEPLHRTSSRSRTPTNDTP